MNYVLERLSCTYAHFVDLIAVEVKFLEACRQVLDLANIVKRQVEYLEILKLCQCLINADNALILHIEITEEVDDVVFHAHVLDWSQFFYYFCQIDGFG